MCFLRNNRSQNVLVFNTTVLRVQELILLFSTLIKCKYNVIYLLRKKIFIVTVQNLMFKSENQKKIFKSLRH